MSNTPTHDCALRIQCFQLEVENWSREEKLLRMRINCILICIITGVFISTVCLRLHAVGTRAAINKPPHRSSSAFCFTSWGNKEYFICLLKNCAFKVIAVGQFCLLTCLHEPEEKFLFALPALMRYNFYYIFPLERLCSRITLYAIMHFAVFDTSEIFSFFFFSALDSSLDEGVYNCANATRRSKKKEKTSRILDFPFISSSIGALRQ